MRKIITIIISLLLICISINANAEDKTSHMMNTVKELSSYPRGYKNTEIENARNLIKKVFAECDLEITEQNFTTSVYNDDGKEYCGKNIIGTLYPNTTNKTNDVLIVGAHYDGVNDMPAANDNASGVSVMLELARTMAARITDTEIRFIAFDCEELGLLGSEYYANSVFDESENIIGMLNFDMLASRTAREVFIYSNENDNYMYEILKAGPEFQDVKISQLSDNELNAASDYISFKSKLIPTLSFSNITVVDEVHTEKDVIENIDKNMLLYAYEAGLKIVDTIANPHTTSYKNNNIEDEKIYTISQNVKFPFGMDKSEFEHVLNIQFNPIISETNNTKYKSVVNMFNIDEPLELIIEESPLQSSEIEEVVTECIVNINSENVFENIFHNLTKNIGAPEVINTSDKCMYQWNDLIYGNSYCCIKEKDNIKLYIRECDNKQKAFFVNNGNIIETVNVYPRDTITIFDNEKELDYKIQNADVSENYEIEKVYADAWIKIKNCLSNAQLSKLKYVILNTNGIGGGGISFEESLPIQYHIDEMLNANKYEKQGLFNGMILHADFMDVTCEMGNLYNEQRLLEDINLAWINRKNGVDIPAKWAYESISDGIKKKILTSDMLVDFNEPINRADFCDILYSFVQQKYNVDDNEKKSFFTDTSKQSVNFLADVGIVKGMEDKLFIPNGLLTREQAALMLARITNLFNIQDENSNENKYNDEDYISEWAQKGVMKMHRLGIMMGDENECFNPQKNCTKEEVIVAIMRLYKLF